MTSDGIVAIGTPSGPMEALVTAARTETPAGSVIFFHEGKGIDDGAREAGQRLAREGYFAVAPDIYRTSSSSLILSRSEMSEPSQRVSAVDSMRELVRDIDATIAYVREVAPAAPDKVCMLGTGPGGFLAFLGGRRPRISATVSLYGDGMSLLRNELKVPSSGAHRSAPLLWILGAEDENVRPKAVGATRARLTSLGVPHALLVYPRARAGFATDGSDGYRADIAADAWRRAIAWLVTPAPTP